MTIDWDYIGKVSNPVIAVGTLIAMAALLQNQFALAHEKRRRQLVTAVEQNEKLVAEFLQRQANLTDRYEAEHLAFLQAPTAGQWILSQALKDEAILFSNRLESWALYALYELADEEMLFRVNGKAFCGVVAVLDTYTGLSLEEAQIAWKPVYELEARWLPRLEERPSPLVSTRVRM